jgi:adenylosuccinate synthase
MTFMQPDRSATIVTDLGFGDAGKGTIVDYLARRGGGSPLVVRFNGGAQAGHNVVTPDGRQHIFHQFSSASFVPGARTHLSRFMLVSPLLLSHEADQLHALDVNEPHRRLTIDRGARIITPYHEAANRLREAARRAGRHGSCGHGIGETMADSISFPEDTLFAGDLSSYALSRLKLESVRTRKLEELAGLMPELIGNPLPSVTLDLETLWDTNLSHDVAVFYRLFARDVAIVDENHLGRLLRETPNVIFEGAQGVLLDEWRGFHPYTTWSTTTFANADQLLSEQDYPGEVTHLGVLRAYGTRHGPGPFVTEDPVLTRLIPDEHNGTNQWQRQFRVGYFDLVAARYALEVAGTTDCLAITCMDRINEVLHAVDKRPVPNRICTSYQHAGLQIERLVPGPFRNLDYQEGLTKMLLASTPGYGIAPASPPDFLGCLEDQLRVPVSITSNGPTALDKTHRELAGVL